MNRALFQPRSPDRSPDRSRRLLRAFTLVEMIVSVALVAILLLAVTQIFSIASTTVGGAQALGAAVRDAQAAQPVLARDTAAIANDAPAFIIRMERRGAFRNNDDYLADGDKNALTIDLNLDIGDGDEVDLQTGYNRLIYNFRNHRTDYLMFFTRDRYYRQTGGTRSTGDTDPLVANMAASEAAVFIHHLVLPYDPATNNFALGGTGAKTNPGDGSPTSNPKNYFASNWILGRVAMLLIEPDAPGSAGIINGGGASQNFIYRASGSNGLAPLSFNSRSTANTGGAPYIQDARYDLAGTSIASYRQFLKTYIAANPTNAWWYDLMCATRFEVNPFVTRPLNAATASQQVPVFVPACSQFIVEFAGDFVTQNASGAIAPDPDADGNPNNNGDGVIDFVAGTNQVRWYGLPRDTNADGQILGETGDVVPVRDVSRVAMSFERKLPTTPETTPVDLDEDYYSFGSVDLANDGPIYVVAWGPDDTNRPKMLRITLAIDRPELAGKNIDGQTFEYVFNVGY